MSSNSPANSSPSESQETAGATAEPTTMTLAELQARERDVQLRGATDGSVLTPTGTTVDEMKKKYREESEAAAAESRETDRKMMKEHFGEPGEEKVVVVENSSGTTFGSPVSYADPKPAPTSDEVAVSTTPPTPMGAATSSPPDNIASDVDTRTAADEQANNT